jgi:hypothetical protein
MRQQAHHRQKATRAPRAPFGGNGRRAAPAVHRLAKIIEDESKQLQVLTDVAHAQRPDCAPAQAPAGAP